MLDSLAQYLTLYWAHEGNRERFCSCHELWTLTITLSSAPSTLASSVQTSAPSHGLLMDLTEGSECDLFPGMELRRSWCAVHEVLQISRVSLPRTYVGWIPLREI